jgi:phosphoribosyl-ATP pyrophosphohydrolase/phosphoribosyl-AMP cyclohydrolase
MQAIDWKKVDNLLPVIVQDYETNDVLMLAYMNQEALELTQNSGFAHYFSRTKQRIWKKGETSNHTQEIKDIFIDCDNDTILIKIKQNGVACHTGRKSCFFTKLDTKEIVEKQEINLDNTYSVIDTLFHTIEQRKGANKDSSYTASLFSKGENSILKKVVEEAGEFSFAVKDKDKEDIIYECADLVYHSLVALSYSDINPDRIKQELKRRFGISGIEEKNSRV